VRADSALCTGMRGCWEPLMGKGGGSSSSNGQAGCEGLGDFRCCVLWGRSRYTHRLAGSCSMLPGSGSKQLMLV
jgi:hypothetical protein